MRSLIRWNCLVALVVGIGASIVSPALAADAVKVSTFAPAEDLATQMGNYLKDLGKVAASEEEYKDAEPRLPKDANAVIVIALSLGLHDQDNKYKQNAPAIIKAAKELAAAKDYAATKKAIAALEEAAAGKGAAGGELKWEKQASLPELMKAVPVINTKLKGYLKGSRFKSKAKDSQALTATIAAIGQASESDHSVAKSPDEIAKWQAFCVQMRNAAGKLNKSIHDGDEKAATDNMDKLTASCDDCHAVFHKTAAPTATQK